MDQKQNRLIYDVSLVGYSRILLIYDAIESTLCDCEGNVCREWMRLIICVSKSRGRSFFLFMQDEIAIYELGINPCQESNFDATK